MRVFNLSGYIKGKKGENNRKNKCKDEKKKQMQRRNEKYFFFFVFFLDPSSIYLTRRILCIF